MDENFYSVKVQLVKAIADGKYPSPPARDLYLVSKGVPHQSCGHCFLEVCFDGRSETEQ